MCVCLPHGPISRGFRGTTVGKNGRGSAALPRTSPVLCHIAASVLGQQLPRSLFARWRGVIETRERESGEFVKPREPLGPLIVRTKPSSSLPVARRETRDSIVDASVRSYFVFFFLGFCFRLFRRVWFFVSARRVAVEIGRSEGGSSVVSRYFASSARCCLREWRERPRRGPRLAEVARARARRAESPRDRGRREKNIHKRTGGQREGRSRLLWLACRSCFSDSNSSVRSECRQCSTEVGGKNEVRIRVPIGRVFGEVVKSTSSTRVRSSIGRLAL